MKLYKKEVILRKMRMLQRNGTHLQEMDINEQEEHVCLNCGTNFVGKFCPNCGQKGNIERLTFREAFDNLLGIFTNFEHGFLHTCLDLCYRPGHMIKDYIQGHRVEYVKPVQLLFLLGTIYIFLHFVIFQEWSNPSDPGTIDIIEDDNSLQPILTPLMNYLDNPTMLTLLLVVFLIGPNHFFFRKAPFGKDMNYAEHFYSLVYISCQIFILAILCLLINSLFGFIDISLYKCATLLVLWDLYQLMGFPFWKTVKQSVKSIFTGFVMFVTTFLLFAGVSVGIYYALFGAPQFKKHERTEDSTMVSRPDSLRSDSVSLTHSGNTLRPFDIP